MMAQILSLQHEADSGSDTAGDLSSLLSVVCCVKIPDPI
jgi:hypothetical protein